MSRLLVVDIPSVSPHSGSKNCAPRSVTISNRNKSPKPHGGHFTFLVFHPKYLITRYIKYLLNPLTNKCSCFTELIWKPPCIIPIA